MKNINAVALEELWKKDTDGHIPVLMEIFNPDIKWEDGSLEQENMYLRVIDDSNPVMYKGKKYLACKFNYTPPEENGKTIGQEGPMKVKVTCVDYRHMHCVLQGVLRLRLERRHVVRHRDREVPSVPPAGFDDVPAQVQAVHEQHDMQLREGVRQPGEKAPGRLQLAVLLDVLAVGVLDELGHERQPHAVGRHQGKHEGSQHVFRPPVGIGLVRGMLQRRQGREIVHRVQGDAEDG